MAGGEEGVVAGVEGGRGLAQKLHAIGIRPGVRLIKTSGQFLRGPVTVRLGNLEVAIGFGMASRVIMEAE
jgi:ferrous iron transport protein A